MIRRHSAHQHSRTIDMGYTYKPARLVVSSRWTINVRIRFIG